MREMLERIAKEINPELSVCEVTSFGKEGYSFYQGKEGKQLAPVFLKENLQSILEEEGADALKASLRKIIPEAENDTSVINIAEEIANLCKSGDFLNQVTIALKPGDTRTDFFDGKSFSSSTCMDLKMFFVIRKGSCQAYLSEMNSEMHGKETIIRHALENLKKEFRIMPMDSFVNYQMGFAPMIEVFKNFAELRENTDMENTSPMFTLTNECKNYGASAMLVVSELHEIAKYYNADLYIFPSSVHEVIVAPVGKMKPAEAREMIREINDSMVSEEERLSYNLYIYRKDEGKLMVCND